MTTEYKDPSEEILTNGRSMADMMRRGPGGIRGAIIAPANKGGTPINFDPHDRTNIAVQVVDPDGRGSQKLVLSAINKEAMDAAIVKAEQQVPQTGDINSIRERAAVIFEELAKQSHSVSKRPAVPPPRPAKSAATQPPAQTTEEFTPPTPAQIDPDFSPMAAFGFKKQSRPAPASSAVSRRDDDDAPAPQKLVYFEKEGIGTIHGFFHDVIVRVYDEDESDAHRGFIVLIYDLRFPQNAARWFPPAHDPYQRPWALKVTDDNRLYLVHSTGFQYVYNSREFCILLIEQFVTPPTEE
jgi:hypothetical protein